MSTCMSEYIALSTAVKELLPLKEVLDVVKVDNVPDDVRLSLVTAKDWELGAATAATITFDAAATATTTRCWCWIAFTACNK